MHNRFRDILLMRKTGKVISDSNMFDKRLGSYLNDRDYGGVITTATGNPVSIMTNKAQNAISTLLSYSPRQSGSGDPSPQNIRPIEGWTEGNLYRADGTAIAYNANTTTAQSGGVTVSVLSSTAFEMRSTGVSEQYPASKQLLSGLNLTNGKTYTIYAYIDIKTITTKNLRFGIRTASNTFISGKAVRVYDVLPVGEDKGLIALRFTYNRSTDNYLSLAQFKTAVNVEALDIVLSQIKVLEDTTSDTPTITTLSLGGTYYGFSVDVERGVLRVAKYGVDLADCSGQNASAATGYKRRMFIVQGAALNAGGTNILCSHCRGAYNGSGARIESVCSEGRNGVYLQLSDETLNGLTVNEYVQAQHNNGTPVFVVGNLSEPLELPLTPQTVALLAGNNTIWTDGDEVSVTYKAKKEGSK